MQRGLPWDVSKAVMGTQPGSATAATKPAEAALRLPRSGGWAARDQAGGKPEPGVTPRCGLYGCPPRLPLRPASPET
jgi:hypothetical protein